MAIFSIITFTPGYAAVTLLGGLKICATRWPPLQRRGCGRAEVPMKVARDAPLASRRAAMTVPLSVAPIVL